jgi:hypothetical protein
MVGFPLGPVSAAAVAQSKVEGFAAMVSVADVLVNATQTVRRCAMAAFCA